MGRRTVDLYEYDPRWAEQFTHAKAEIIGALGEVVTAVHHIGSTSVPGLVAKCTIDIAVEVTSISAFVNSIPSLEALGYEYRPNSWFHDEHAFLRRIQEDERTHHLHVIVEGHPDLSDWIDFRDYLREHPPAAQRYGDAKRRLAAAHYNERRAYVDGKTAIVEQLLAEARSTR